VCKIASTGWNPGACTGCCKSSVLTFCIQRSLLRQDAGLGVHQGLVMFCSVPFLASQPSCKNPQQMAGSQHHMLAVSAVERLSVAAVIHVILSVRDRLCSHVEMVVQQALYTCKLPGRVLLFLGSCILDICRMCSQVC